MGQQIAIIRDLGTGVKLRELVGWHVSPITSVVIMNPWLRNPDSDSLLTYATLHSVYVFTGSEDGNVVVWDVMTGKKVRIL